MPERKKLPPSHCSLLCYTENQRAHDEGRNGTVNPTLHVSKSITPRLHRLRGDFVMVAVKPPVLPLFLNKQTQDVSYVSAGQEGDIRTFTLKQLVGRWSLDFRSLRGMLPVMSLAVRIYNKS